MAILPKVKTPAGQPNYQQMLLAAQKAATPAKAGPTPVYVPQTAANKAVVPSASVTINRLPTTSTPTQLPQNIVNKVAAQEITPSAPPVLPAMVPKELSGTVSPWMADMVATAVGGQAITTATAGVPGGGVPRITANTNGTPMPANWQSTTSPQSGQGAPAYNGTMPTTFDRNPTNDENIYGHIMLPTSSYGGQKPTVDLGDFLKTEAANQQYWVSLDGPPISHIPTTTYPHGPINTLSTITGGVTGYQTGSGGSGGSGGGGNSGTGGWGGDYGNTPYDYASSIGMYAWRIGL